MPEIARLYNFPTELDGEGQTIGLLEFGGGINPTDLKTYFRSAGLSIPNVVAVPVNGAKNDPKDLDATSQVMMDIEVVGNIAPKANIRVYFAPGRGRLCRGDRPSGHR